MIILILVALIYWWRMNTLEDGKNINKGRCATIMGELPQEFLLNYSSGKVFHHLLYNYFYAASPHSLINTHQTHIEP